MDILTIKNLNKKYDKFELKNVSFCVPAGTIVGLIGENGAGKSTVIRTIIGASHPESGEVLFKGKDLRTLNKEEKQRVSVVLDDTGLPLEVTTEVLNKILAKIFSQWDEKSFSRFTERLDLPNDKPIKEFSKGMKMKAAIAVALSHDSDLLILDEPTSGLDPVVRDEILGLLYDYAKEESKAVLISSHITSDLEKLCDYIVYIHKGQILLNEEKDRLLDKFVVFSCDKKVLHELNSSQVIRYIGREFGADVLSEKKNVPKGFIARAITLDDLMLFYSKGAVL